jgi:hypothetical protein
MNVPCPFCAGAIGYCEACDNDREIPLDRVHEWDAVLAEDKRWFSQFSDDSPSPTTGDGS